LAKIHKIEFKKQELISLGFVTQLVTMSFSVLEYVNKDNIKFPIELKMGNP